jgi:hypothetical protein
MFQFIIAAMLFFARAGTVVPVVPPTCTNVLNFSVACNSQYVPVVLR